MIVSYVYDVKSYKMNLQYMHEMQWKHLMQWLYSQLEIYMCLEYVSLGQRMQSGLLEILSGLHKANLFYKSVQTWHSSQPNRQL